MIDSTFEPSQFLDAITTEAATRRPPLPPGEYIATVGEPDPRINVQGKKDPSKTYNFIDFPLTVDVTAYPSIHSKLGVDNVKLRHSVSLDITDGGALDWSPGRNTGLRFMREATKTNTPGEAFSIRRLEGRTVKVKVSHREYPEHSGEFVEQIDAVVKP